jgi:hypothetical protein
MRVGYTEGVITAFLSQFSVHIPLSTNLLIGVLIVLLAAWIVHMLIVRYHWQMYGNDKLAVIRMSIYYFTGSAILFSVLVFFLVAYSSSVTTL